MSAKISALYVDIDALFDTRAGTLASYGMEKAAIAIGSSYYTRQLDAFEGIDMDDFSARYARRDRQVLYESLTTPIARQIQRFVHQTTMAAINSPYQRDPLIVLNTYPYVLTAEEEQIQILGLRAITKNQADIELIHEPLDVITPRYVKDRFVRMIMYAYWDWLEIHSVTKALADSRCQTVSLLAPQLMRSKEALQKLRGVDAYNAIEEITSRFIQLCLLPVSEFCVDLPRLERFRGLRTQGE